MKKRLITMLMITGMMGTACIVGHYSEPKAVHAEDLDNGGYDILEDRADDEDCDDTDGNTADGGTSNETGTAGDGTQGEGNTTESGTMTGSTVYENSTNTSTVSRPPHVLDQTPKTADIHAEPMLVLSSGLFFFGTSLILLDKKKNGK